MMKTNPILSLSVILPFALIISCSGSSGEKVRSKVTADPEPDMASKRLIEVLAPADNAAFSCGEKIVFSVGKASGNVKVDSVQIWASGKRAALLTSLPGSVEIAGSETPGRKSYRVVAYSPSVKPHTITLFVTCLSDINPVVSGYKVVKSYPHDSKAFTQGLVYDEGYFYEGTGQQGESSLRKVVPETGKVLSQLNLDASLFGEGVALLDERIYQLTWTSKVGFVYDKDSFRQINKIYYQTEGWGLTTLGNKLVMSDGTNVIWFMDQDFNVLSSIEVWDNKGKVDNLNELEMINGELWANIWQTDRIARIDIETGKVLGYIDLSGILPKSERTPETEVLNGIAWDAEGKRLFVTGKYWPRLYEIVIVAQDRNL